MSDFIKNLKSLFVEDDPSARMSESEEAQPSDSAPIKKEQKPSPAPQVTTTSPSTGEVSQKFTKILLKAIEKYNQEGFDYLEYKNSVKSLSKMAMDEPTKYQSAFAMAQTMGADSKRLIDSAKHYQKVLSEEKKKFDQAATQQVQSKINNKKLELKDWESQIAEKEQQIKQLQKQVQTLRQRIAKANESVAVEEKKVEKTKADFVASFNNLYNQIEKDIQKMTNYLK